ncbi:MAG: phenylalanine--tRNA ligase subunit beta [Acidobacteriota bacterium]|nr:MAG: phenylalanine--tRNA ligase subunit beta [Acidobacteriota bacterium]
MPVVGFAIDELFERLGQRLDNDQLEHELHRFGCSVEGWATLVRYRCPRCDALLESIEDEPPPAACDSCGADLADEVRPPERVGEARVLRMELLAVRPDLFDPPGLARALRGFLGFETGAPRYELVTGSYTVDVDPALRGPEIYRPRIACAVVRGLKLDDARLRSLMKLQENIHWALGRDRKLASIGVYDLGTLEGPVFRYCAVARDGVRFVPLGFDPADENAALTPDQILREHPKGTAFARLLEGCAKVPLLVDSENRVLSMPPIINSEATRVTLDTKDVFIDVTGLEDRQVVKALNIVVTSLLEACPEAHAESVTVRYERETRTSPDLSAQRVNVNAHEAARLVGVGWTRDELIELLERMRHDAQALHEDGASVQVEVPAWRADILHPRDLVEDAAIAHGYDRLPQVELGSPTVASAHPRQLRAAGVREVLIGLGCLEVFTLALTSEKDTYENCRLANDDTQVKLENPISVEQTMLRISLLPGLFETLAVNLGHAYPQRIFEVGSVALHAPASETGACERLHAAVALAGDGLGYADARALLDVVLDECGVDAVARELKPSSAGVFLAGRGASLFVEGRSCGMLGEVHPAVLEKYRIIHPVVVVEIDLDTISG